MPGMGKNQIMFMMINHNITVIFPQELTMLAEHRGHSLSGPEPSWKNVLLPA